MLWRKFLPPQIDPSGVKARYLGDQFPVAPSTILQVGADLKALAEVAPVNPTQQVLARMVLDRSRHNLSASAAKVTGRQKWEDIVLPSDILNRCLRIAQFVKYQRVLSDSWGFGRKLLTHSGVSALFSGPPGVGKTMMAGIIGRELGLDVYRIDLSRILSKWVGETEKNLSALIDEANRTRAVLVFDEADALFSKRTDVNSSSDRYSNVEVNYLLQKMEVFDGIIILTTNLEKGIDEAFVRRLDFRIRFPEPTLEERQEMWERMLPAELQYGRDVDLAELARNFEMTGGYIKKALIRAGLIAIERSAEQRILFQEDLRRAISEEMQEAGRLAYDIDE
jgi:SpoVK/Ycf46/Vps4 family AAA+-type ATPase